MSKILSEFNQQGFVIRKFKNIEHLNFIRSIIDSHFDRDLEYYSNLETENYRELVLACQEKLNQNYRVQKEIIESEKGILYDLISEKIKVQTILYLRTSRPYKENMKQEQLDWHRETFYSDFDYIKKQHNFWFPIYNCTEKNSMKYIPFSHKIPDRSIKVEKISEDKSSVKRFSTGHKLGLVYSPKKIVSGVNFSKQKNLFVPMDHYVVFSAMLIHGAAKNFDNKIRYSSDFGILDQHIVDNVKFSYAADNKPQYINYEEM